MHFERYFTPCSHGPWCLGAIFRFVPLVVNSSLDVAVLSASPTSGTAILTFGLQTVVIPSAPLEVSLTRNISLGHLNFIRQISSTFPTTRARRPPGARLASHVRSTRPSERERRACSGAPRRRGWRWRRFTPRSRAIPPGRHHPGRRIPAAGPLRPRGSDARRHSGSRVIRDARRVARASRARSADDRRYVRPFTQLCRHPRHPIPRRPP